MLIIVLFFDIVNAILQFVYDCAKIVYDFLKTSLHIYSKMEARVGKVALHLRIPTHQK